jgi:anti-anti-sigma regulatory factor
MSNSDMFGAAITSSIPAGGRLLVDLTAVEYLDSAGLPERTDGGG